MRSTRPMARRLLSRMSSSWYFTDEEPELRTRTRVAVAGGAFSVEGGGHALLEVWAWIAVITTVLTMSCTSARGQVVDGLAQALQDRADGDRAGRALYGLVGVVAGVQVGEDQHGRLPGDLQVRHDDRDGQFSAASYWIGPSIFR